MTSDPPLDSAQLNHQAGLRMKSGIALLEEGDPQKMPEAVRFFDEAIELRRQLPLAENPGFRYGLAAGWVNRGDALARMAGPENLAEAVRSYTAGIELLREVPADDEGLFVRRLAIAWINRGVALESQASEETQAEAIRSYREAIAVLTGSEGKPAGNLELVLAGAWLNWGNAVLRSPGGPLAAEACDAAQRALSLLGEAESRDQIAAETGLKARHIQCQAMIVLIQGTAPAETARLDLIGEITDAVENALQLVQLWEKKGVNGFAPLAPQFFHLGSMVYEREQPHFLADFVLDYLEPKRTGNPALPEPVWFAIAAESLGRARVRLSESDITLLTAEQRIRKLEILNEIRAAEAKCHAVLADAIPPSALQTSDP